MSLTLKKVSNRQQPSADDEEPYDQSHAEPHVASPDETTIARWRSSLIDTDAQGLLKWALDRWAGRIAVCTAFQAEGSALLDMAWRLDPSVRVMTLDTGRLPQETHDLIERVRWRYGIRVEVHTPDRRAVEAMMSTDGPNLFYHSVIGRQTCCQVRKVAPLEGALSGLSAWITGLRRDQTPSRASIHRLELDAKHDGIVKLNPLADWNHDVVWAYLRTHDVPYHPLYDQGYTSIGCAPCTRPVEPDQDPRSGRWWWEADGTPKECGLHFTQAEVPLIQLERS
ncbi:MAG: phosphoadenylyl-sulfate reductase [Acidobacteriota bacterium]